MRRFGKKMGKFSFETVLARYDLDVRLDVARNQFVILLPNTPGEKADPAVSPINYECFSGAILEEVKKTTVEFAKQRDVTEYVDVIEYECHGIGPASYDYRPYEVGFNFRVARVSVACSNRSIPKLEQPVEIDDDGNVTNRTWNGDPCLPQAHRREFDYSMEFTVERWRKCCAIRDGIEKLNGALRELLGKASEAGKMLDSLGGPLLLVGTHPSAGD